MLSLNARIIPMTPEDRVTVLHTRPKFRCNSTLSSVAAREIPKTAGIWRGGISCKEKRSFSRSKPVVAVRLLMWSNSNPGNNDGEGTAGTDRHNLVQMMSPDKNVPVLYNNSTMWKNAEVLYPKEFIEMQAEHLALTFATSGYHKCFSKDECDESVEDKDKLQPQLDNAPASFQGMVLQFKQGTYHYMCTRNNNFSNRSQKGTIIVVEK